MGRNRRPGVRKGVVAGAVGLAGLAGLSATVGFATAGPAGAAGAIDDRVPGTPCSRAAHACVDIDRKQAWLIDEGAVGYGPVPVSTGWSGSPTPTGTFRVEWKDPLHVSGESGVPMPYSVFFAPGGIAFHQGSLQRESEGCVHLRTADAAAFYDALDVGDDVEIH